MFSDKFKEWFWDEVAQVKGAKVAFVLVTVVAFGFGWWAASWFFDRLYSAHIRTLEAQVASGKQIVVPPAAITWPSPAIWGVAVVAVVFGCVTIVFTMKAKGENRALIKRVDTLQGQHREATNNFKKYKIDAAHRTLNRWGRFRFDGEKPTVLIRFVGHGKDHEIVKEIEKLFTTWTDWPVTKDGTNNPPLEPDERFKVIFEKSHSTAFDEIAHALSESDLLGVTVGEVWVEDFNQRKLVIRVLPS